MKPSVELAVKRIVLTLLGLVGLVPMLLATRDTLRHPSRDGLTALVVLLAGSSVWAFLLPRWDRWRRLKPGNRVGLLFLGSYLAPVLLLALAGAEHVEDVGFVAAPLAAGVTALWWAWRATL